jgi:arylsulfatase A-like enzyme
VTLKARSAVAAVALALLGASPLTAQTPEKPRVLIIVVDGLRPDYVTHELMPTLYALGRSGFVGDRHHAVFPTVTRVNSPSIATGAYPRTHGAMENSVYLPGVDSTRILNTGSAEDLRLIDEATGGRLLTAPSLGEILDEHGLRYFAASSGSTGSAVLMNHRAPGGAMVHQEVVIPDTLTPVVNELLGVPPPAERPSFGVVRRAVDALLQIGVDRFDADGLAIWITEPDGTAHATGIGSPQTREALRGVDVEIGRLLRGLTARGVRDATSILVTSDHGFATRVGARSVTALLVDEGLKESRSSMDVVVAGGAITVNQGGERRVGEIVRLLQATDWIGPVFTLGSAPDVHLGSVPGTLSFASVFWDHPRAADILFAGNWSSGVNEWGYEGEVTTPGVAGHGSLSPHDVHATFLAAGRGIKQGVRSSVPTGNVDLAPTLLHLLGLPPVSSMDGRILNEALSTGPDPAAMEVRTEELVAEAVVGGRTYRQILYRSEVEGHWYVDFARVVRRQP